jgi:zinc transporter ZupT
MATKLEVEATRESAKSAAVARNSPALVALSALVPLFLLAGVVYLFLARGIGIELAAPAPIENIEFERVELYPGTMRAHIINTGPEAVTIEQVQIGWLNRSSWDFAVHPSPTIPRLGRAVVEIAYPWVPGEPYEIALITANTLVFAHDIEIAQETPIRTPETMFSFALLGLYVGVIPVFLGIGWLPFLRALPQRWYFFFLSLTVGLLVFLLVDALHEALENAARVPGPFQGVAIILIGVTLSVMMLYAVSNWLRGRQREHEEGSSGLLLAYSIAFGIGLHNLGEGLAIGGAYALGEVAMGAMLVLGFTLHNLTEGVAIVAPVVRSRFRWRHLVWLGVLGGVPTIFGALMGAFAYTAVWAVLFLAIGAGAILQVVIEVTRHQVKTAGAPALVSAFGLAGFAFGLGIMYVTGLFVTV